MIRGFVRRGVLVLSIAGAVFSALVLTGCGEDKVPEGAPTPSPVVPDTTGTPAKPVEPVSATPDGQTGIPKIETSTVLYDIGTIPNDRAAEGEFAVFNRGTAPLIINKVTTSCGCTQGKAVETTIPPGGQTAIKVTVDPFRIPQFTSRKTLTISTNDPANPQVKVDVVARVEPELEWEPASIDFGVIERGQPAEATILIRQLQEAPLDLANIHVSGAEGNFTAASVARPESEWKTPGKREFSVTAKLSADAAVGPFSGTIAIETGLARLKRVTVHAKANIKGPYAIEPRQVVLRDAKAGQVFPAAFTVSSEGALEIKGVVPTTGGTTITPHPAADGKSVVFDVTIGMSPTNRLIRDVLNLDMVADGKACKEKINLLVVLAADQVAGGAAPQIKVPTKPGKPLATPPVTP